MEAPRSGTAPLKLPAVLPPPPPPPPPAAPTTQVKQASSTVSMAQDMLGKLASAAAPMVPDVAREAYNEAMPWASDKLGSMKNALLTLASNMGVEQHWGHSCTAAAAQAAWKKQDPKAYEAAEKELLETGATTLPGPPPEEVTLDQRDRDFIDRECEKNGYSEEQRAEMYMQAALMEYATDGAWSPIGDILGTFDGASQEQFGKMAEALGLELETTDSLNTRFMSARLRGQDVSRAEVLDQMLQENAAEHPGEPIMMTVTSGGENHAVNATPTEDGKYYVKDGEGNYMPPGVEQPMTAETLEQHVPYDGDDVGARKPVQVGSGSGET